MRARCQLQDGPASAAMPRLRNGQVRAIALPVASLHRPLQDAFDLPASPDAWRQSGIRPPTPWASTGPWDRSNESEPAACACRERLHTGRDACCRAPLATGSVRRLHLIGRHLQHKFAQALAETALHSMPIQVGTLRNTAPADAGVIQVDAPSDNRQRTARMRSEHEMTAFDLEGYFDCARAVRTRRGRKTIDGRVNQRAAVQTYLDIQRCVSQAQFRFQKDPLRSDGAPPLSRGHPSSYHHPQNFAAIRLMHCVSRARRKPGCREAQVKNTQSNILCSRARRCPKTNRPPALADGRLYRHQASWGHHA
jgi:hypothetical protein